MSWLRIDDGFSRHPKVTALNHKDRWAWVDVLCYCARYRTDGYLPENIREHVAGASDRFVQRCVDLGLLDDDGECVRVHDWKDYAPTDPTGSERQAAWRRRKRNGDVTAQNVTELSTSRVGTRARSRPVPSEGLPRAVPVARPPASTGADEQPSEGEASTSEHINESLEEAS